MFGMGEVEETGNPDGVKEDYEARDYQVELLSIALNENTILYLPTGSGKTFVAVMLLKCMSQDLEMPYRSGGKRSFFAVNTVALVKQQGDYIARHTNLQVGKYSGDLNVDNWDADRWEGELRKNQVFVLTCQILLDMLHHGFVHLEDINLIIFDECHHAVADHCMRRVMQRFEVCPKESHPRVLGLSATLLNSNCKSSQVTSHIKNLESTFQARIATVDNIDKVKQFSTNPCEEEVMFEQGYPATAASCINSLKANLFSQILSAQNILQSVNPKVFSSKDETMEMVENVVKLNKSYGHKEKKRLLCTITDVKIMIEDLGIYGGDWAALSAIVALHRRKLLMQTDAGKIIISALITHMTLIRKIISDEMEKYTRLDRILKFSTNKVLVLLDMLIKYENANEPISLKDKLESRHKGPNKKSCALIFVERRQSAKTLYQILKHAAEHHPSLRTVSPEFVVGIASNPASAEAFMNNRRHTEAIKKFRNGECNYLVASDVMEEGVDIPQCALVVKLDLPKTFRSYVQSKGRARHSTSRFVMFVPDDNPKFSQSLKEFRKVEATLKQILIGKTDSRKGPSENEVKNRLYQQIIPPYYSEDKNASIDMTSATALIARYCSILPQDKFTQLYPLWLLDERVRVQGEDGISIEYKKTAYLQLPINSPLRNIVKGIPMENKRLAKRAVALITCVELHRMGEFGNDLLPVSHDTETLDGIDLFPHWRDETSEDGHPGTKKKKRIYSKQVAEILTGCHPQPGAITYVHHINQTPVYERPRDSRGSALYDVLKMNRGYAIISSKKLPEICDYSIFMSSGEVAVKIGQKVSEEEVILSSKEINELEEFHTMLFLDLLKICKEFVVVDKSFTTNSYLIAPTCTDGSGRWVIDWDVVRKFPELPYIIPPPEDEVIELDVSNETFLYEVVTPWYRGSLTEKHYVVTRVCDEMSAESPFPSTTYSSYEEYFQDKYDLKLIKPQLPLLEVKAFSSRNDFTQPRVVSAPVEDTPQIFPMSKRQMQLKQGDFNEHLIPELVTKRHFPATLWIKSSTLPTILHRVSSMLLAFELRAKICLEANIGTVAPPVGKKWRPLQVELDVVPEAESHKATTTIPAEFFHSDATRSRLPSDEDLVDLDRDIDQLCLLDVMHYHQLDAEENNPSVVSNEEWHKIEPASVPTEVLNRLHCNVVSESSNSVSMGPELADVLSALTGASAGDVFNLERLETLGDSFLKFAVSTYLFLKYPKIDEGKLTSIKGRIISNRNLFYCAEKKNLGEKLKAQPFAPRSEWIPPGFTVHSFLKEKLSDHGGITNSALFKLTIPEVERRSGQLSRDTKRDIVESLEESKTNNTIVKTSSTLEALLGRQSVPDKSLADCVEALIGAWLINGGFPSAIRLLGWFGILPSSLQGIAGNWEELVGDETLKLITDGFIKDQQIFSVIGGVVDWAPDVKQDTIIDETPSLSIKMPLEKSKSEEDGNQSKKLSNKICDPSDTNSLRSTGLMDVTLTEGRHNSPEDNRYDEDDSIEVKLADDMSDLNNVDILSSKVELSDVKVAKESDFYDEKNQSDDNYIIDGSSDVDIFHDEDEQSDVEVAEEMDSSLEEYQENDIDYVDDDWHDRSSYSESRSIFTDVCVSDFELAEEGEISSVSHESGEDYDMDEEFDDECHDTLSDMESDRESDYENIFSNQIKRRKLSPTYCRVNNIEPSKTEGKLLPKAICKNSGNAQMSDERIKRYIEKYHSKRKSAVNIVRSSGSSSFMVNPGITKDGWSVNSIDGLLVGASRLEETIGYTFKNRCLLLQALTHASYHPNRITECYQRLEFLGDAILDFVITCHIFETCGKLDPGQLTDLRSALVNNITFASLVVRYGLHRYLLHLSPSLMDVLDSFVDFQVQRNHAVTEECLVLMEEDECYLAESVEVPKALGDIMESLAGAIFLDSGFSLSKVWDVFYPMMKSEIDAFTKKVPKQPVRELLESTADVSFLPSKVLESEIKVDEDSQHIVSPRCMVMVPVEVRGKQNEVRTFYGFGERKSLAKRAAAKLALRAITKSHAPRNL